VEPAAAAERHPPLSHAQQSQSLTVNLKDAVTATVRKAQPSYLPGIGLLRAPNIGEVYERVEQELEALQTAIERLEVTGTHGIA